MHIVRYCQYPNNELRVTHYYRANPKEVQLDDSGEFLSCPPSPVSESEAASAPETSPSSLDISVDFSQRGESNPHRRTKFGSAAKNTILRMGGALDTVDSTPSNYIFLTGTIPGGTHDAFMAVAIQSPYIVQSIAQWLKRTAPCEYWFYVWELQKRGALHIHYCIHAPDPAIREKILSGWRPKWESILQQVQEKTGTDIWQRSDGTHHEKGHDVLQAYAQTVRKSVAAYMAGYCSSTKNKHQMDSSTPYYPKRYWGASRKLTNLLKGLTKEVVVEHNGYREARKEIQAHYEQALHDSPKAYHYPHKVGIGSTCVSYHPEDKGLLQWQRLNPMLYSMKSHPNTVSTIVMYRRLVTETMYLLEASPAQIQNLYRPLLLTLRGCIFPTPDYGYSIALRDMRVINQIPSDLSSALTTLPEWERLRMDWCLLKDSIQILSPRLTWCKWGSLSNEADIFRLLDNHWSKRYACTSESKDSDTGMGGANGSLSPQPPSFKQLNLLCSSD